LGREVVKERVVLPRGRNLIDIEGLDNLASGVYIFSVKGEDFALSEKMLKLDGSFGVDDRVNLLRKISVVVFFPHLSTGSPEGFDIRIHREIKDSDF